MHVFVHDRPLWSSEVAHLSILVRLDLAFDGLLDVDVWISLQCELWPCSAKTVLLASEFIEVSLIHGMPVRPHRLFQFRGTPMQTKTLTVSEGHIFTAEMEALRREGNPPMPPRSDAADEFEGRS